MILYESYNLIAAADGQNPKRNIYQPLVKMEKLWWISLGNHGNITRGYHPVVGGQFRISMGSMPIFS